MSHGKLARFSGVGADSRLHLPQKIFFALKGPVFDGHDFLPEAFQNKAAAFVLSDRQKAAGFLKGLKNPPLVLIVEDSLKALQDFARFWRNKLRLKIIAVTGSNGKTTVKHFTKAFIQDRSAYFSPKSWNNHWGVPLSILSVSQPESLLVQEIGTGGPGEIAPLTALCDPQAAAVANVGPAHLKGFGSMKALAWEKQQIYLHSPKAEWVFNRDNSWTEAMLQQLSSKKPAKNAAAEAAAEVQISTFSKEISKKPRIALWSGEKSAFSSQVEGVVDGLKGSACLSFAAGEEERSNLMCAMALAGTCGVAAEDLWKRLKRCRPPKGRKQWLQAERPKPFSVLFDAYNANPASMRLFFNILETKKPLGFVLGDMKELGPFAKPFHKALSEHPALQKAGFVLYIGEYGAVVEKALQDKNFKGNFFWEPGGEAGGKALQFLTKEIQPRSVIGFKASRAFRLEDLLFRLTGIKITY